MPDIIHITNWDDQALDLFARTKESSLLHPPAHGRGIFIAESPLVVQRALAAGYEPISFLMEEEHIEKYGKDILKKWEGIPVYTAPFDVLTKITGFKLTRGMLCAMYRKKLPTVEQICEGKERIAILEDVVNPTNVGAIFRSAAALNMEAVLLTADSSDPLYRRAIRVSMGTVFQIPWTFFDEKTEWKTEGIRLLKAMGFKTAAMALKEDSFDIDDPHLMAEEKLAVVLGTEGDGLASETIADCDYTVCIPMAHGVDSLNVAAASAVAFWQLGKH